MTTWILQNLAHEFSGPYKLSQFGTNAVHHSIILTIFWTACLDLRICKTGPMQCPCGLWVIWSLVGILNRNFKCQQATLRHGGVTPRWLQPRDKIKDVIPKAAYFSPHPPLVLAYSYWRICPASSTSPSTHFNLMRIHSEPIIVYF